MRNFFQRLNPAYSPFGEQLERDRLAQEEEKARVLGKFTSGNILSPSEPTASSPMIDEKQILVLQKSGNGWEMIPKPVDVNDRQALWDVKNEIWNAKGDLQGRFALADQIVAQIGIWGAFLVSICMIVQSSLNGVAWTGTGNNTTMTNDALGSMTTENSTKNIIFSGVIAGIAATIGAVTLTIKTAWRDPLATSKETFFPQVTNILKEIEQYEQLAPPLGRPLQPYSRPNR